MLARQELVFVDKFATPLEGSAGGVVLHHSLALSSDSSLQREQHENLQRRSSGRST